MANKASPSPPAKPRQKKYGGKNDRRSCDGILKLAVRFEDHKLNGPWTVFSDKRFDKNFDRALFQLTNMVDVKFKGKVAWAEIYDCSTSRFGPVMATYKQKEWHFHRNA